MRDELRPALKSEMEFSSMSSLIPAIITTTDIRPLLRAIISQELPQIPVLCYQELTPDANLLTVGEISF